MNFRPCVIHVGSSEALSAAVQEALFRLGYHWEGSNQDPLYVSKPVLYVWRGGEISYGNICGDHPSSAPRFDAATQFGALLEYLDKPEEVKVELRDGAYAILKPGEWTIYSKHHNVYCHLCPEIVEQLAASQAARKEGE